MAQIANVSLTHEVKLFGHRAWELGAKIESDVALAPFVESLRQAVAEVPRRLARAAAAPLGDARRETHELLFAFRALTRAVEILDRLGREKNDLGLDALALAQEGAELSRVVYERVA